MRTEGSLSINCNMRGKCHVQHRREGRVLLERIIAAREPMVAMHLGVTLYQKVLLEVLYVHKWGLNCLVNGRVGALSE